MRQLSNHRLLPVVLLTASLLPTQAPQFRAAADYSRDLDGLALLVLQDDQVVFEEYHNGYRADRPHHIYSGTKSFAPLIALVAEGEGLLTLDEPVCKTITEWQDDPRKAKITIRHLLTFTSGLRNIDPVLHRRDTPDKYQAAIQGAMASEPGRRFRYGSNHLMVFGEVMKRKLARHDAPELAGKDALAYLEHKILRPIGMRYGTWMRDRARNPMLPYGAFLTAREWAKFGQLVLHRGRHGDRQVVPARHFDQCFVGTEANPAYGLNWWLIGKRAGGAAGVPKDAVPNDAVGALGMYNQKLYVIPSRKMVVVRFGKSPSRKRFGDAEFLGRLFADRAAPKPATTTGRRRVIR